MRALRYVQDVTMVNIPALKKLILRFAFVDVSELEMENACFRYVNEVKLIGLSELESMMIGMKSFTKHKYGYGNDPNRHFYLKNCPKLKSLKIGDYSFNDYSVIEIENVNALEEIEFGDLKQVSPNFESASLELKRILIHSK